MILSREEKAAIIETHYDAKEDWLYDLISEVERYTLEVVIEQILIHHEGWRVAALLNRLARMRRGQIDPDRKVPARITKRDLAQRRKNREREIYATVAAKEKAERQRIRALRAAAKPERE